LRDCAVVITGWSEAPIPWPRCRALDGPGGGSGILLDEELARAVRCKSAAAVANWWRVTPGVVWRWRKALGVTCKSNEGSRRLLHAAAQAEGAAVREREYTEEERAACSCRATEQDLIRFARAGYVPRLWTPEQLRLLGKEPDDVVAGKTGRSAEAVRSQRTRLGIPSARDRRRKQ
jgi:hypothetical protein